MRTLLIIPALILLTSTAALGFEPGSQPSQLQDPLPPVAIAQNENPVPQAVIGYQSSTNSNAPIIMPNKLAQAQPVQPGTGISPMMNDLRWLNF